MKNKSVVLLGLLLGLAMLAGCSKNGDKVLSLWYWDQNADPVYEQLVKEYQTKNPGIKITTMVSPWDDYWTKLQTAMPTGTGPDVFWLNHPNAVSYLPTGLVMDLEGAASDIHFENFDEKFITPYAYQNKRYGVPIFWDSVVLYYNKALFDKAGVAYPDENWTWAEFYDAAEKLTVKDGNKTVQYGALFSADPQHGFTNFVYQNGGRLYNDDRTKLVINSPEAREAIQLQLDAIYKNGYAPTSQIIGETSERTLFVSGTVAMLTDVTAAISQYSSVLNQNVQIAPLPMQKQRASVYHNLAYVASAKTKYPEEVKKFMAFLASKEHANALSKVWAPCFKGTSEQYYGIYNWINIKYIDEAIQYGMPLPVSAKNAGSVYTLLNNEMTKIYTNAVLGDSLANLEAVVNSEIDK